ncbi:MAG: S8 family serine peptidase [Verrucomicrobia bacterium]|nr:S8 family serine peptidase [Verrucomicrobiota bacterium]
MAVSEDKAEALLTGLRNNPDIEFAERDFIAQAAYVPNDTYVVSGSEWHLAKIQAMQAWDVTMGRSNVIVAVLDSGVNRAHPDLLGRILPGYDFVSGDNDPADDFGHGTAVAGTIVAAGNNGVGVAGVVPGCTVLPVKILDASGFGTYSSIAEGVRYAVDQGASVINLSVAGNSPSSTLQDAISFAWSNNVVVVAAAGNNANSTPQYPAACAHVVAVSATEPNDTLASFSSYGSYVTLSAPGDNIWTTQRDTNNPYGAWRGTSFASPIVAGIAALVASENPSLSNDEIVSLLQQTADDAGLPGYDTSFGYGRVNAFNAIVAASALPGALPPQPPPPPTTPAPGDTNAPVVTITQAPANGARLSSPFISLAGTAEDDVGVQGVQVQINGSTELAEGTTNWSGQITLSPGVNTVLVHSVDLAGNVSSDSTITYTYVVNAPLTVQTNGAGSVTPNLNGKLLEIGRTYTARAVPAAGQLFAGWAGMNSDSPTLNFVMQPNLVLVANFVPSPFPAVKGSYAGLVANVNDITPDSAGYFTLTVTVSGAFTGKLLVGGSRCGFRGQFNLDGDAIVTVSRPQLNPLTLTLQVDLTNGTDQVTGSLTDGNWTSALAGDRNVFNSQLNPAAQAGAGSLILENTDASASVLAAGASKISSSGAIGVRGKLADGRPFGARSTLAKNGDSPFYLSLDHGNEVVIGWVNFSTGPSPIASGTVHWVKRGANALAATLRAASAP